jgi:hypothetical protein
MNNHQRRLDKLEGDIGVGCATECAKCHFRRFFAGLDNEAWAGCDQQPIVIGALAEELDLAKLLTKGAA